MSIDEQSQAKRRFAAFLQADCPDRVFSHPTGHPSSPSEFCFCDGGLWPTLIIILRSILFQSVCAFPFNSLTCTVLRLGGVRIGKNVHISAGAWFDPMFPHLIHIEDGVFIGMNARFHSHEVRIDTFRAGRVFIRRGAFIGAYSLIACGVEVGEGAIIAAATALARDVPAGQQAIGNPARILIAKERT